MNRINQYINSYHGRSPAVLHEIEQQNVTGSCLYPYIGPNAGRFLYNYVLATRPMNIIELGTGTGYATIWLALAAASYGGKITTVEHSEQMLNMASNYVGQAGLSSTVVFVLADAREWAASQPGSVDLILQDTYPRLYNEMLEDCIRLLKPGKALITHDALLPVLSAPPEMAAEMERFNQRVYNHQQLVSTIIPVDDGLLVSLRLRT